MMGLPYILTAISWICLALLVLTIFYLLYATPCSIITHPDNKFMALMSFTKMSIAANMSYGSDVLPI